MSNGRNKPTWTPSDVMAAPETHVLISNAKKAFNGHLVGMIMHGPHLKGEAREGDPVKLMLVMDEIGRPMHLENLMGPWRVANQRWNGYRLRSDNRGLGDASYRDSHVWSEAARGEAVVLLDLTGEIEEYLAGIRKYGEEDFNRRLIEGDDYIPDENLAARAV